ncbi:hypothetical protein V7S43_006187 [Phytophthora oleae]|uniref:Uncharacterized protein n=1 Tax=Phytophthora oleae TaxID=2107226 RepID=A0ABD3FV75_9STRA
MTGLWVTGRSHGASTATQRQPGQNRLFPTGSKEPVTEEIGYTRWKIQSQTKTATLTNSSQRKMALWTLCSTGGASLVPVLEDRYPPSLWRLWSASSSQTHMTVPHNQGPFQFQNRLTRTAKRSTFFSFESSTVF